MSIEDLEYEPIADPESLMDIPPYPKWKEEQPVYTGDAKRHLDKMEIIDAKLDDLHEHCEENEKAVDSLERKMYSIYESHFAYAKKIDERCSFNIVRTRRNEIIVAFALIVNLFLGSFALWLIMTM